MGYLSVKDSVAVDLVLANQSACVLTEVVEDLYYRPVF
jgi:hypothetical protein